MKTLGILGQMKSAIGAALLGTKKGYSVFLSDMGAISPENKILLHEWGVEYEEGGHTMDKLSACEVIVKSPGIPDKAPVIKSLRNIHRRIVSEIEFASWCTDAMIIAVTGSNGKTTTTRLLGDIFIRDGKNTAVGGNIGVSFAALVAEKQYDYFILEISSFQLDDIESFRPHIAILLNITPDHLDRYNYSFDEYIASKFRITQNQTEEDYFIFNQDDEAIVKYMHNHSIKAKKIPFTQVELLSGPGAYKKNNHIMINNESSHFDMSINELKLKGRHNVYNSMAAGIGSSYAGIRNESVRESFCSFNALAHRLEEVSDLYGIAFINDSKATNVNSTWYALDSQTKPVVWIAGGIDKGNDYSEIKELVAKKVKALICLGLDNEKLLSYFKDIVPVIKEVRSMREAVGEAYNLAQHGEVVLLSPACASMDLFKNYEDRGEQFRKAVNTLGI